MFNDINLSRRKMVKASFAAGVGAALIPETVFGADSRGEPHFVLHVHLPEGADCSYMFDARPLSMTFEDKLIQNYISRSDSDRREPFAWTGENGTRTLASDLVKPLRPFKNRISVVNGVHMFTSFEGHEQNANYLFTGNPFGGDFYLPGIHSGSQTPLGFLQMGNLGFGVSFANSGEGVKLNPTSAAQLAGKLKNFNQLTSGNPLFKFMKNRSAALGKGNGKFSAGARAMHTGVSQSADLARKFGRLEIETGANEEDVLGRLRESLAMTLEMWRMGLTNQSALGIETEQFVDTHDAESASEQEAIYSQVVDQYATILSELENTEYQGGKSFLDVTTVMFSTEFSRTMRQQKREIDQTGTDHNPLNNSFLLAGKGIRGGMVVGASDFSSGSEILSQAHVERDKDRLKMMGRPFDFARQKVREDLPSKYEETDYITSNCVINTLLAATKADKKLYRQTGRNGDTAPVLTQILA